MARQEKESGKMNLSKEQQRVLIEMSERTEPTLSAYDLRTTMNTMYSLLKRDLIKRTNYDAVTWFGWERTGYEFAITDSGRKLAKELLEAEQL